MLWYSADRTSSQQLRDTTSSPPPSGERVERKAKYMTTFINGKQKRVPRPQLIEGVPVDECIARNADPIWLHQHEMWELMTPEDGS